MYPVKGIPTEKTFARWSRASIRARSLLRSPVSAALTIGALVVSGAAIAPVRVMPGSGGISATTKSGATQGRGATGGLLLAGDAGLTAESNSGVSGRLLPAGRRGLLATRMVFLGETGSPIHFDDNGQSPEPGAEAGIDADNPLLSDAASAGRLGSHGSFTAAINHGSTVGMSSTMFVGTSGYGSSAAPGRADAPGTSGVGKATACGGAGPCTASDIVLSLAPLTVVEAGKGHADNPGTNPGTNPGNNADDKPAATDGGRPTKRSDVADVDSPLPSPQMVIKEFTPPSAPPMLVAAADLPPVNVPEPGSIALLAFGAALLTYCLRRRPSLRQ